MKYHQIQPDASSGELMFKGGGSKNLSTMESKHVGMQKHFLGPINFLGNAAFSSLGDNPRKQPHDKLENHLL